MNVLCRLSIVRFAGFGALLAGANGAVSAEDSAGDRPTVVMVAGAAGDPIYQPDIQQQAEAWQQAATTSGKPILLRLDYNAGHGYGSTKKSQYEERADTFAFLFWQAGAKGFWPKAFDEGDQVCSSRPSRRPIRRP